MLICPYTFATSAGERKADDAESVIAALPAYLNSFTGYDELAAFAMKGRLLQMFCVG